MKVSSPAWKLPRVDFPNGWGRLRTPRVKHHESETLKSLIRPSDVAAARDVRPSVCLINYRCKVRKWSSNRNISSAGGWKSKYRGWYCFKSVRRRANSTRIHIRKDQKSQSDCWYVIKKAYLTRGNHQDYMILIGHHVDEAVRGPLQEHQTDEDPKLLHHAGSYKSDGTGSKARQRAGRSRSDKHLTTSSRSKFPFTLSLCSTRTRACSSTRNIFYKKTRTSTRSRLLWTHHIYTLLKPKSSAWDLGVWRGDLNVWAELTKGAAGPWAEEHCSSLFWFWTVGTKRDIWRL